MGDCSKCRSSIRGESGVKCRGVCGRVYHSKINCSGLDQYCLKALETNGFLKFMCDDCMIYIHNVDQVLKDIQDGVNQSKNNLKEYKAEFVSSMKNNEREIKTLLEAIEKRYEERFNKMENLQKVCEKNMEEVNKVYKNVGEIENKNKEMCNEIKKTIIETSNNTNKVTFSQVVKSNKELPEVKKLVPLVVKPKEKQGLEKTKKDLNNKVDPVNFKVTNVENRKNGVIVIQSENMEEREKIKTAIVNEMSANYEIKIPKEVNYQVLITDMTLKYTEDDMKNKLKRQNIIMENSEIEIKAIFETKRYNKTIYNARINIDCETYVKVIEAGRINVGWERCRVYDGTRVTQCFKCYGYNHRSSECRNSEICYKCHGQHKSSECQQEIIKKCINCVRANNVLKLNLNEEHYTNDRNCPVYENKMKMKKQRMDLNA